MNKNLYKELQIIKQYLLEKGQLNVNEDNIFEGVDLTTSIKFFLQLLKRKCFEKGWIFKEVNAFPNEKIMGYIIIDNIYFEIYSKNHTINQFIVIAVRNIDSQVSTIIWEDFIIWIKEYYIKVKESFQIFNKLGENNLWYNNYFLDSFSQFCKTKSEEDRVEMFESMEVIVNYLNMILDYTRIEYHDEGMLSYRVYGYVFIDDKYYLVTSSYLVNHESYTQFIYIGDKPYENIVDFIIQNEEVYSVKHLSPSNVKEKKELIIVGYNRTSDALWIDKIELNDAL